MGDIDYLMEHEAEAYRLDLKTDEASVREQALWAGMKPGMRVADVCCGAGRTTAVFGQIVGAGGSVVGIDGSAQRISYAREHYGGPGITYVEKNIRGPLSDLGEFDFVWIRFVLEYFRSDAQDLLRGISGIVKPGGILCLIDLDHNCLNHYGMSRRLEETLFDLVRFLEEKGNFDPYAGRKLYSHLYRLGYTGIRVDVSAHHLIYGPLNDRDAFNWYKKVEVAAARLDYAFPKYPGGFNEFIEEFGAFFASPERFTYTPLICCTATRPTS